MNLDLTNTLSKKKRAHQRHLICFPLTCSRPPGQLWKRWRRWGRSAQGETFFGEPQECNQPSYMYKASWCFNARGNKSFILPTSQFSLCAGPSNISSGWLCSATGYCPAVCFSCRLWGEGGRFEPWLFPLQQMKGGNQWKCDLLFSKSQSLVAEITHFTTNPQHIRRTRSLTSPKVEQCELTCQANCWKTSSLTWYLQLDSAQKPTPLTWGKMLLIQHSIEAIQHNVTKRMHAQSTRLLIVPCLQKKCTSTKHTVTWSQTEWSHTNITCYFEATAESEAFLNLLKLMVMRRSGRRLFGFLIGKRSKMQGVANLKRPQA